MKQLPVKKMVSEDALDAMKKNNMVLKYSLQGKSKVPKYSKVLHLEFFRGYDLLENLLVARPYIQKRYNIDLGLLEVLLYLGPKQFFTQKDFSQIPKQYKYGSIRNMIGTGYVGIIQNGDNLSKHLYRVNKKGSEIIRHFYEILSGEKKIGNSYINPLARKKTRTPFDKKKMDLIDKINELPAPESKKPLYL